MDRTEFMKAYLQHRKMLQAFIVSIVRDRDAAEDLFQDVSMIAFDRCTDFETGTRFGAWLREIARRRILKARDSAKHRTIPLDSESIEVISAAHERLQEDRWQEQEPALRECMKRLPERNRLLVEMRYRNSLGFDVIAKSLNRTVNSVQVTLSKIRKKLRLCMEARLAER